MPSQQHSRVTFSVDTVPPASTQHAVLTCAGLVDTGRITRLGAEKPTVIGRSSECTLRLHDVTISSVHAEIVPVRGAYYLNDHHSTNGTYLNDVRVTGPALVRNGDIVRLGPSTLLRFSIMSEDECHAVSRLYEMAVFDHLTEVHNRNYIDEKLRTETAFARTHGSSLGAIVVDLDRFKAINDQYGHPGGDAVLRAVARAMRNTIRGEDLLGRYGGEEFLVLSRGHVENFDAVFIAERLKRTIAALEIAMPNGERISVTASFGVAWLTDCGEGAETLVEVADRRLFRAKAAGRNCVVSTG